MWTLTANEKKKLNMYWEKFEDYVTPRSNFRLTRYKLSTIKQELSKAVDSFLKKVCMQSKLLEHDETLTLDKAINIARTQEAISNQLQDIRGSQTTTANALRQGPHTGQPPTQGTQAKDEKCGNCGNLHDLAQRSLCPAYGTKCEACGRYNH